MASISSRLPSRFPVGTKLVIEGKSGANGQVFTRHLEFPDGTFFPLPSRTSPRQAAHPVKRNVRRSRHLQSH